MNKVYIIAEAGVNHNGSLDMAKKLVDAAVEAGADAVKFQCFKAEKLVSKYASKAEYQKETTGEQESQLQMIKKLELGYEEHRELKDYCIRKNIDFLSSPFDLESIGLLDSLGMEVFKIPSGEIENLPYLRKIGSLKKKVILSSGMSTLSDIEYALGILRESGAEDITVLHCNTEYPTPMEDVNLRAMITIREAFKVRVGYSDHTLGMEIPIAAVALGAEVIEKHFTLDKTLEGPDHRCSLEPWELKEMVRAIRNVEKALGSGIKSPSKSERKNMSVARKSLVAGRAILKGEVLGEANLAIKRPGTGISPKYWSLVAGRRADKNYEEDELIEL